jgi:hypothetical protein
MVPIRPHHPNLVRIILMTCALAWSVSACSLLHVRKEAETIYDSAILVGLVSSGARSGSSPIVVAAYAKAGAKRDIAHFTVLHEPGPYELIVPRGSYYIFAFADTNRDLIYQASEPAGQYSDLALSVDRAGGVVTNLNIVINNLVAHSMGGLVVRSFLVDYGQQFPSITKFISISTPWSGDNLSEYGVKYSPGVIPAWRDMGPQSDFAQSIYRKKLPAAIDYYLFFGHKGNRNPLRPNNDGVVTLATQLGPRAQSEAKMVCGFDEDHSSILASKQVATHFSTVIDSHRNRLTITSPEKTGPAMRYSLFTMCRRVHIALPLMQKGTNGIPNNGSWSRGKPTGSKV